MRFPEEALNAEEAWPAIESRYAPRSPI